MDAFVITLCASLVAAGLLAGLWHTRPRALAPRTPVPIEKLTALIARRLKTTDATRVKYLAFLCEWKCALVYGRQISDATWYFGALGTIHVGDRDRAFYAPYTRYPVMISAEDASIVDWVLAKRVGDDFLDLSRLVYSVYPIFMRSQIGLLDAEALDLIGSARRYLAELPLSSRARIESLVPPKI